MASGRCRVCGKPGTVHVNEINDGRKRKRSFCMKHAPTELKEDLGRLMKQAREQRPRNAR